MIINSQLALTERADLTTATTEELRHRLAQAIGLTAAAIRAVSQIWAELDQRGEDMSRYRFALRNYMRGVAAGTILPETVAALAGQRRTLDAVSMLPPDVQRSVVSGTEIEIARLDGAVEKKRISDMTLAEVSLSIRDGRLRSLDEQRLALRRADAASLRRPRKQGRPLKITLSADGLSVRVGTVEIDTERLIAALRAGGAI